MLVNFFRKKNKYTVLVRKSILIFILSVIFLFVSYFSYTFRNKFIKDKLQVINIIKKDMVKVQLEFDEFNRKSENFLNHKKIWDSQVGDKYKKQVNNVSFQMIKNIVDSNNENDNLGNILVRVGQPASVNNNEYDRNTKIYSVKVNLSFDCLYEKQIYDIMNDLIEKINAYTIFNSVRIVKNTELNKKFITAITKNEFIFPLKANIEAYIYYVK